MSKPIIAIVGRPNVGKSMLFNKIIGRRLSIVEDTPGVTRDRIYGESDWQGRKFTLIDTGGIEPRTDDQILAFMRRQAQIAIDNADGHHLGLTDIKTGLTAADQEVATMLQRSGKPVVLAVNKMRLRRRAEPGHSMSSTIWAWATPSPSPPSTATAPATCWTPACSTSRRRTEEEEEDDAIKVAVIGKPNAGKSSLVNQILGEERVIVSDVAGTTRDAIDSRFENDKGKFCLHRHRRNAPEVQGGRGHREVQRPAGHHGHRPGGRVPHHDRRHRGRHRAGHQGGRSGPRGGQGHASSW